MLRHYLDEGTSQSTIARKLGVSRRAVYRYQQRAETERRYRPRTRRSSPLDPFKEYVRGRLEAYPESSAVRLLGEIRRLGYQGCYTIVKDCARALRPRVVPLEQWFDVAPAEQAQVDFARFRTPFGVHYFLGLYSPAA